MSTMKVKEGVDVLLHSFITLALGGGEWSVSHSGLFTRRGLSPRHVLNGRLGEPRGTLGGGMTNFLRRSGMELRSLSSCRRLVGMEHAVRPCNFRFVEVAL